MPDSSPFQLWIEAEEWAPGEWDPADDVTDAIVTLADGTRWVASFCSFAHIARLRANCAESGECLGGRYLWASDLILVDDTSRPSLEAVVRDLLAGDELRSAFSPADDDGGEDDGGGDEGDEGDDGPDTGGVSPNGSSPEAARAGGADPEGSAVGRLSGGGPAAPR